MEKEFAFGLFELDYDVFGVHIEGAVNRVPCLEQVQPTRDDKYTSPPKNDIYLVYLKSRMRLFCTNFVHRVQCCQAMNRPNGRFLLPFQELLCHIGFHPHHKYGWLSLELCLLLQFVLSVYILQRDGLRKPD